ncbi:MAG: hypothetical protein PHF60_01145 [Candidatus ainarchaeum sp.]|nr:hypothetical protein [Candidatus ainarchaeum sp.]
MILQLIYFALISLGLGFALWRLLGIKEEDSIAAFFLYIASGLAAFVLLSTVLGFFNLAIWYVYGVITLVLIGLAVRKEMVSLKMPEVKWDWIIVLLLFLIHLYVYATGAFNYPWLEDDDPWNHATAVRYVSIFGTYIQPDTTLIHYLAPYPPFFDVLLGTIFQVDGSALQFTLKFFNALLVSLVIPLFYCWTKKRFDGRTALWATAILACLPSFMSHFIWAQTLAMLLVFPAFYFLDRYLQGGDGKRALMAMGVVTLGAVFMTQPSVAGIIFVMTLLYVAVLRLPAILGAAGKATALLDAFMVPLLALLVALLLFWIPMFAMYGAEGVLGQMGLNLGFVTEAAPDTSGGVVYGINDFLDAPFASKMDQPTGWGIVVTILMVLGLAIAVKGLKGDKRWLCLALIVWFVFCMIGVEGNAMPLKMMPHRFWVFLAIPVAVLAAMGTAWLIDKAGKNWGGVVAGVIVLGLIMTAASAKYVVETSAWPPGTSFVSNEQVAGYAGLKALPANTKVFGFCDNEDLINGMGLFGYGWVTEVRDYKMQSINDSVQGNYDFLKKYGYEYTVIDQTCLLSFTPDEVNGKLNGLLIDSRFQPQQQLSNNAFIVFKVAG